MNGNQPHPATPGGAVATSTAFRPVGGKKRGSYNCGRCGAPKKGHVCHLPPPPPAAAATPAASTSSATVASPISVFSTPPPPRQPYRALSFDDIEVVGDSPENEDQEEEDDLMEMDSDLVGSGKLTAACLWEVMRRLPPPALLSAAKVCKGWRDTSRKIWRAAEELRLRVPAKSPVGFAGSVLRKCPGLLRLSLRMESFPIKAYLTRLSL